MKRAFHLFLLILVAVALPIQGYAAVAMVACESMHAREAHHHASGGAAHENHDAAPSLTEPRKVTCSACAACCTGTAVPLPALPALGMPPAVSAPATLPQVPDEGVILEGLERPPRKTFA